MHTHTHHTCVCIFGPEAPHAEKGNNLFFQNREDQRIHHHTKGGKGGCNGAESAFFLFLFVLQDERGNPFLCESAQMLL